MEVKVMITKNYYKATTVMVTVPDGLTYDEQHDYITKLEDDKSILSDELANASLNADMDGMEIEIL